MTYDPDTNKSSSNDPETPALVLLADGGTIAAQHQFVNTDDQLVVYLQARDQGIDARITLEHITAVIKTLRAAREFGVRDEFRATFGADTVDAVWDAHDDPQRGDNDNDDNIDGRLMTDGGLFGRPVYGCKRDDSDDQNQTQSHMEALLAAEQCDIDGCETHAGRVEATYCDEHLNLDRDGVTVCAVPGCSELAQPGVDVCSDACGLLRMEARNWSDDAEMHKFPALCREFDSQRERREFIARVKHRDRGDE